jgi:hypothetical protein
MVQPDEHGQLVKKFQPVRKNNLICTQPQFPLSKLEWAWHRRRAIGRLLYDSQVEFKSILIYGSKRPTLSTC